MAGEQSEAFPEELRGWVERRAAEHDAEPAEIVARAVAAYRYLVADADVDDPPPAIDPERLDGMDGRIETLADRVGGLEDHLDTQIDDVRARVVQVKRETDAKAPRDHDHPDLADRVDEAVRVAEDADARVDDVADRLERGFENYEEVLEYLTDATDDLEHKADRLASVVVDLRSELRRASAAEGDRRAVDDLRTEANRHGERTAACADCGATVDLGLLSRPRCPHCEATYVEFEPSRGFFGSATLVTGERPALTDGEDAELDDATDIFDEDAATDTGFGGLTDG